MAFELADGVGELVTLYFRNKMDMGGAHRNRTQINADSHRFLDDRIQRDLAGVRIQPNRVAVHDPCRVVAESRVFSSRRRVLIITS